MDEPPRTILVVDDEPAQRKLLGGFLESLGFQVREAESAEAMLEAVRQTPPDLILLDVRLPGMSGVDALPEIRKLAEGLPVILITAHADLRQAVSAVKTGADDYLVKPLELDALRAALTRWTNRDIRAKVAV